MSAAAKKVIAASVFADIEGIRERLSALISELEANMDADGWGVDTDRVVYASFAVGHPVGLQAALDALEGLKLEGVALALDPVKVQRRREERRRAKMTPAARAFVEKVRAVAGK